MAVRPNNPAGSSSRFPLNNDPDRNKNPLSPAASASALAWWIAILLCLSLTLNFVDRLVLGSIAPILRSELHFSNTQYSYIVFAFMAGMTLGQIPAGSLIDRIGVRTALPTIFSGWSFSNMLQSFASGVTAFSGLRFLMGLFECGNFSAGLKTIGEFFPAEQRAFALGIFNSGA